MRILLTLAFGGAALFAAGGCNESPTAPASNALSISSVSPAANTTTNLSQYRFFVPGGLVIPPGSGPLSVRVELSVADRIPWAQLSVYLLTGGTQNEYCGQNTPDAPTWQFLKPRWSTSHTVTGFRVYRLPCDVTGIRAILHMRNNGNLMPATGADVIAEAVLPTTLYLRP